MARKIIVKDISIGFISRTNEDYISLTDIAKMKNKDAPADVVKNWIRTRSTIELLGLWEKINNSNFKLVEFDGFKNESGSNFFVLSPQKWIETTSAKWFLMNSFEFIDVKVEKNLK